MANQEVKYKNLVYLMLTRYKGNWEEKFPEDMGMKKEDCEILFNTYGDKVAKEIQEAMEAGDDVPTADELINKGLKKLNLTITTCDDPAKLTRSIEALVELRNSGLVKTENRETIFDKMQNELKKR